MRKIVLVLLFFISFILTNGLNISCFDDGSSFHTGSDGELELYCKEKIFDMLPPQNKNDAPSPTVHYLYFKRITVFSDKSLTIIRFLRKSEFLGYRLSPQGVCCFSSHNMLFVKKMRRITV